MKTREVVLCHPVRTAIGAYHGSLKATPATELGAAVIRETVRRSGVDPERIGSVVIRRGIVTLCIGGGQGIALAFEALD